MTLEQIIEFLEQEVKCCERWQRQNATLWEFYKGKIDGLQMALDNLKTIKSDLPTTIGTQPENLETAMRIVGFTEEEIKRHATPIKR